MNASRFQQVTGQYSRLKVAIVGDFCLDRYLEIDPSFEETSIETGLPVHNVVRVRAQPGGAGTVVNNLSALGIGTIYPVGFCGNDGEGFELQNALLQLPGVSGKHFFATPLRRTFTYCKPLVLAPGKPPVELNRLDSKNWTPTPAALQGQLIGAVEALSNNVDAFIILDQVDAPDTGVVAEKVLTALEAVARYRPHVITLADSRRRLKNFQNFGFKVNRREFASMADLPVEADVATIKEKAAAIAQKQQRRVFVTLSEHGILGASPTGEVQHVPALPVNGPIDIVGAGDAVLANVTCALAAGAHLNEALELATAAASIVIHQLGTTGTASIPQIGDLLVRK